MGANMGLQTTWKEFGRPTTIFWPTSPINQNWPIAQRVNLILIIGSHPMKKFLEGCYPITISPSCLLLLQGSGVAWLLERWVCDVAITFARSHIWVCSFICSFVRSDGRTDGNFPLCSIGYCPLRVCCPRRNNDNDKNNKKKDSVHFLVCLSPWWSTDVKDAVEA